MMTATKGISTRTWIVGAVALAASVGWYAAVVLLNTRMPESVTFYSVGDFGSATLVALAGAFIIWCASRFGLREPVGINWLLIGISCVVYAMGDVVYGYYEVIRGVEAPYPGLPDVFYVATYVFFAAAVLRTALSYRGLVKLGPPALASAAAGIVALLVAWVTVLGPAFAGDSPVAEKAINFAYPLGDVLFMICPAVLIALVVWQLGRGRLAWPWILVTIGAVIYGIGDVIYAYLTTIDKYQTGSPVDIVYVLAYGIFAVAASVAMDAFGL